jgi:hypothetical protein
LPSYGRARKFRDEFCDHRVHAFRGRYTPAGSPNGYLRTAGPGHGLSPGLSSSRGLMAAIRRSIEAERRLFSRARIALCFLREFIEARVANAGDLTRRRASECFLLDCSSMSMTIRERASHNRDDEHQSAASRARFVRLVLDLVVRKKFTEANARSQSSGAFREGARRKSRLLVLKTPGMLPDCAMYTTSLHFFCSIDVVRIVQQNRAQLSDFVCKSTARSARF